MCALASPQIEDALQASRLKAGLSLGPGGLSWRLGYLVGRNPGAILTVDDRLRQLNGIPSNLFTSFSRSRAAKLSKYGYLVLDSSALAAVDERQLRKFFHEDQAEGQYILFVRKEFAPRKKFGARPGG